MLAANATATQPGRTALDPLTGARRSSRDEAEYQAELDERRQALDGYVATKRRWVEAGWNAGNAVRVLSGLVVWGGLWRQHRDRAEKSILFGPPAVLEVTYTLEGHVDEEE